MASTHPWPRGGPKNGVRLTPPDPADRPLCGPMLQCTMAFDSPQRFLMANRENISVSLTPQQTEFLAACVASGRYESTSEVVREGLRLLQDHQERRKAELERARALIQEGADQLDRGEAVDGEMFFHEWNEELDVLEAAQRHKAE